MKNEVDARRTIREWEKTFVFERFKELLLEKNKQVNLTRIVSDEDYSIKNVEDSLLPLFFSKYYNKQNLSEGTTLMDLGVGGGFPLFPLYLLCLLEGYSVDFVGLDSVKKKLVALEEIYQSLLFDWDSENAIEKVRTNDDQVAKFIPTIRFFAGRAEELGREKKHREQYDIVVARAVASLPVLLEYASPFVKKGGIFVAYKGVGAEEELLVSKNAEKILGLELVETIDYELREDMGSRTLLVYQKVQFISKKYPRNTGIPKKKPL